jgi:hypothetical protein
MAAITRSRVLLCGAVVAAAGTISGILATSSAHAATWAPNDSEIAVATAVAHAEADTSQPGSSGNNTGDAKAWPTNVTSVYTVMSTRKVASQWVDNSVPDSDQNVVVVRMEGDFSVYTSGPEGSSPNATGTRMTIVADASTGQVLDFGMDQSADATLPNAIAIYQK